MDINAVDSGSRVTRSLRKRLTSIDSDNSSRPGTPLSTKLTSITEASASPSKSTRSTRRNSVSGVATPVKTPSKRGVASSVIVENPEAPLPIRNTRRRSAFTNENDETRQMSQRLDKEVVQTDEKQTIVTRSKSKSPQIASTSPSQNTKIPTEDKSSSPKAIISIDDKQEIEVITKTPASKKRKPGPKSKTREHMLLDDMSDVEIADIKDETSDMAITLVDDDPIKVSNTQKKEFEEHEKYSKPSSTAIDVDVAPINGNMMLMNNKIQDTKPIIGICARENDLEIIGENVEQEMIPEAINVSMHDEVEFGEQNLQACYENKEDEIVGEQDMSVIKCERGKDNFEETGNLTELQHFDTNTDLDNCETSDVKELSSENGTEMDCTTCDKMFNDCMTPEKRDTPGKTETSAVSTINSHDSKEAQKKVDFTTTPSNDTSIKIVYPKTPVSTGTPTSCKNLRSSENDGILQTEDIEMIGDENIETNNKEIDQSSKPTDCEDLKAVDDNKMEVAIDRSQIELESNSHKEIDELCVQNDDEEELNWINPSVKGNTEEGSKLDVLTNTNYSHNNTVDITPQSQIDKETSSFSSDGEEIEAQEDENDDYEEECDRMHDYIDGEAVEVENYQSGDSMDSDERLEIELNEIPIDAESIGSQNTDGDEDEYAEEEHGDNSFIVSDNEILMYSGCEDDRDEEVDECPSDPKQQTRTKLYKRIVRRKESSSSSDEMKDEHVNNYRKDIQDTANQNEQEENENLNTKSVEEDGRDEVNDARKEIFCNLNRLQQLDKSVCHLNLEVECDEIIGAEQNDKDDKRSSSEDIPDSSESDADKENKNESLNLSGGRKSSSVLGVSFQNCRNPKENIECQKSFTLDITLKDGELETKLTDVKSSANDLNNLSSTFDEKIEEIENKGIECIGNIRQIHLPLGNPLIRTRRQSLALPTNPDMEICSSAYGGVNKKSVDRKSFCALSNIDLNPSQSFIETIELLKKDKDGLPAKTKRLSKSFGGSTEAHDNNIVDVNVSSLHKASKTTDGSSLEESGQESAAQSDSSKIFAQNSSTPHERNNKNDSYSTRILTRCDEILGAANRAKLEAKLRNKKIKTKTSKKWKKKSAFTSSEEISPDDKVLRNVAMEIKRKDKKTAISQAFMAADVILNKPKIFKENDKRRAMEKSLEPGVIENIRKADSIKKICGKGTNQQKEKVEKMFACTSAGNFMVFPQTPEKKKEVKYIQLPTGKVSVEPVTPKRSFNGSSFRESPLTPCTFGFRTHKINLTEDNMLPSTALRTSKRKRHDDSLKNITKPNAQWTQSGLFREEVILDEGVASKKTKRRQERKNCNARQNFKEIALSRPDINRSTKRELFLIRERVRACGTKNNT